MEEKHPEWLPHLSAEVVSDARGPELDAYIVALEGWRRGLTLQWHTKDSEKFPEMKTWFVDKPGKLFSLSSGERTHYFFRTRGDKVTNDAVEIGGDKEQSKVYLSKAGVPVPEGQRFKEETLNEEIMTYVSSIGYPVVLKPTDGSFGRGVVTNIDHENALEKALQYVRSELNEADVLIERHIFGDEYRLYVVKEEVVGAMRRVPAHVTGDGIHSIQELVAKKNEQREQNPRLISCPINIDQEQIDFLQSTGYTLESIPEKGEQVLLTTKSNISLGGDPVDVLDELPDSIKQTAVNALKAIPGLPHGAVDLIIVEHEEEDPQAVVLEINPTAQIGSLLFPMQGQGRDVPKAIIDYYFPETQNHNAEENNIDMYFGFKKVIKPLVNKAAIKVMVPPYPRGNLIAKKYTVFGDFQGVGYLRWIQKQAFLQKLSGHAKFIKNDQVEVLVAGIDSKTVEEFKSLCREGNGKSEVQEVTEEMWKNPVKIGFETSKGYKLVNDKKLEDELNKEMEEMEKIDKDYNRIKRKYRNIKYSFIWRYSLPLRKLLDSIKALKKK